jgi:chromosome segregation ATPase
MSAPQQEAQPSKTANGTFSSSFYTRSVIGFRNWWLQRNFSLAADQAKSEAPAALRDAALQFSSRVWDIAQVQAQERLSQERAAVNERVTEANTKASAATLARGRAENHASQLEKKLSSNDRARHDLEKDLAVAETRAKAQRAESEALQKKQQAESESLYKDRADLERRLQESEGREADLQAQIGSLRTEIGVLEADAEKYHEQQQQQLEKAKQHYASLESRLASLLEEHKSARVGLEKGARHRN